MSSTWYLTDLEATAIWAYAPPRVPWRSLPLVFRVRTHPSRIVWPFHVERGVVYGWESSSEELERAVEELRATRLDPREAALDEVLICETDGSFAWRSRADAMARRVRELYRRLRVALEKDAAGDDLEDVADAYDAARLVEPLSVVANVVRTGFALGRGREATDWPEETLADLERSVDFHGDLATALTHPSWGLLPARELRDRYFEDVRRALDARQAPPPGLEPAVPAAVQLEADCIAALRLKFGAASTRGVPHSLLAGALTGDPGSVEQIWQVLRAIPELRPTLVSWRGQASAVATTEHGSPSSRARYEDLWRYARTLHRLEVGAEEPDRLPRWRAFVTLTAGFEKWGTPVPWQQGEAMANDLRARLGLNGGVISGLTTLMREQAGSHIQADAPGRGEDVTCTAQRRAPPCTFVGVHLAGSAGSSRFALAHVLAHLVADRWRGGQSAWSCTTGVDGDPDDRSDEEKRANAFAAYFLAPRGAVRRLVACPDGPDDSDFIEKALVVSRHFGMNSVAAAEHLKNCASEPGHASRLPPAVRERLHQATGAQQLEDFASDRVAVSSSAAALGVRGGRYLEMLRVWRSCEHVAAEEAASLLGVDEQAAQLALA